MAAIISLCGKIEIDENDHFCIKIHTENAAVARKYFTLLKKTFNISTDVVIRHNAYLKRNRTYAVVVSDDEEARRILVTTKLLDEHGEVGENLSVVKNLVIQNPCCRRAFLRGAFLAAGSISDPERSYHFEIVCREIAQAKQLQDAINSFEMEAKIVERKKHQVVYLKEGAQIVDMLNIMEAHVALMNLENVRILKEMRNSVNRKVNCETANISKTVAAAVKQLGDIEYIKQNAGLDSLPENLKEMALLRLEYPDTPLKELGTYLDPPVGKSGVNHRLRRISEIADELREKE